MNTEREGYGEAVVFLFYKDGEILIEHRPDGDTFLPNGGVEEEDKEGDEDYRITALKREVREELGVEIHDFNYLTELKVDEINVWFYVYMITEWEGEIPEETTTDWEQPAELEWIDMDDVDKIDYETSTEIVNTLRDYIEL